MFGYTLIKTTEYNELCSKAMIGESLQSEVNSLRKSREVELEGFRKKSQALEQNLDKVNKELLDMGKDFAESKSKVESLSAQNRKLVSSLKDYSAKNKDLEKRLDKAKALAQAFRTKNAALQNENTGLKKDAGQKDLLINMLGGDKVNGTPEEVPQEVLPVDWNTVEGTYDNQVPTEEETPEAPVEESKEEAEPEAEIPADAVVVDDRYNRDSVLEKEDAEVPEEEAGEQEEVEEKPEYVEVFSSKKKPEPEPAHPHPKKKKRGGPKPRREPEPPKKD